METLGALAPSAFALGLFLIVTTFFSKTSGRGRLLVILLLVALIARYLYWRITGLVANGESFGSFAHMVLALELLIFTEALVTFWTVARRSDRSLEADRSEAWVAATPLHRLPKVDVFIPTYNEGAEVLERTVVAAKALDYPRFHVYVLDDGRREWVRELCAAHGATWITRPDNAHAKAGNVNHALQVTDGDLIALFDADFCPKPQLLRRTVGFFAEDDRIGIVQLPQTFFNPDPIQLNLGVARVWPDDQRVFFEQIMPARDARDVAFCCGSNAVLRRDRLMAIGGIPTDSVTEDILTTLVQLRRGWITRYLNEPLALGLCPESLDAFLVQRRRWCRGNLQLLFCRQGPLGAPGLSLAQRIAFLPLYWGFGLPTRVFLSLLPAAFLWFGLTPIPGAGAFEIMAYLLPVVLLALLASNWLMPGSYMPIVSAAHHFYLGLRLLPTVFATMLRPFGEPFRVTPKGRLTEAGSDGFAIVAALAIAGFNLGGIVLQLDADRVRLGDPAMADLAVYWALCNVFTMLVVFTLAIERPRLRGEERFPVDLPAELVVFDRPAPVRITNLSRHGARLEAALPWLERGTLLHLRPLDAAAGESSFLVETCHEDAAGIGVRLVQRNVDAERWLLQTLGRLNAGSPDQSRRHGRLGVSLPATLAPIRARLQTRARDLSISGIRLVTGEPFPLSRGARVAVRLPGCPVFDASVASAGSRGTGIVFDRLQPESRESLIRLLFGRDVAPPRIGPIRSVKVLYALARRLWGPVTA
ncbi:MAG: glycosyltransferase [Geminicoccaceae bacterium]|nr:MAG: glycosyltransferase [Geminicoccaceae bacterium]